MNHLQTAFFNLVNHGDFISGIQKAVDNLAFKDGIYTGDNLFTYGRNLSFLEDQKLMDSHGKHAETPVEQAILWRIAVVAWGGIQWDAPGERRLR